MKNINKLRLRILLLSILVSMSGLGQGISDSIPEEIIYSSDWPSRSNTGWCTYDFYLIRKGDKYGARGKNDSLCIPIIYDDIYLMEESHPFSGASASPFCWVKKDSLWAIVDGSNSFRTEFVFYDIDLLNETHVNSFVEFARLDTSNLEIRVNETFSRLTNSDCDADIYYALKLVFDVKNGRNYHIITRYAEHSARMADGYHVIRVKGDEVQIDEEAWDEVIGAPAGGLGMRIGKKFGYNCESKKDLKYRGLVYMPCNDRLIGSAPPSVYAIVKRGRIRIKYTYSKRWERYAKYKAKYKDYWLR